MLATGLATSGFLGTITAMAQSDIHKDQNDAATPTPSSVVVKTIQRITYVDENGNPVAPPSSLPGGTVPGVVDSVPVVPTATTLVGTPLAPGTPVTTAPGTPVAPGTPTPVSTAPKPGAPAPVTTKPGAPAPATTQGPAPVTTKAPTPVTTQAPAPATTKPPATTQPPAPPTTKAPACTGSKCP